MFLEAIKQAVQFVRPPDGWKFTVIMLLGILVGLGAYVVHISKAASYLFDSPATCVNCHVMNPQFATWERGSHGRVTTCNDCHVPHNNVFQKYFFKAQDGVRHATIFTLRLEPQVIQIKEAGRRAVQDNCIRCHFNEIHPIALRALNQRNVAEQTEKYCWDCHRETPHGRVNSLSAAPYARIPGEGLQVSAWIKNLWADRSNIATTGVEKGM